MTQIDQNLVQQLSLAEKAALVSGKDFWFTAGNQRVNLQRMMMTDGPSGLRKQASSADALGLNQSVTAICFPASSLTACSFDRNGLTQLGTYLGEAARAEKVGVLLGPGINLKRSPLAGRNFEYFSEDPYLAGELAVSYVNGVQQQGVGVSVKHFAANNRENQRFTMSSDMDERTLRELYLAPFEKVVKQSHPATIMCSYNAINGTLNSQNQRLLTQILRDEWGFDGLVMSDWGAVADHVAALKAGLDLEMPGKGDLSVQEIIDAVDAGELGIGTLNRAASRVLRMVAKWQQPAGDPEPYDLNAQHEYARQLAAKSMVLLQNNDQVLPLKADRSLAVLGALAKTPRYQGGGSSHVNAYRVVSPLEAIQAARPEAQFAAGYQLDQETVDDQQLQAAVEVAKSADQVVLFAGYPAERESEGFDKTSLSLPENQTKLIEAVAAVNDHVTVVLQNGAVVLMPWQHQVAGILETYLAGEAVGEATWDVLSGRVNPSGRLAETFPLRLADTPSALTFNADPAHEVYREGLFMGYRYYDKKQLPVAFPFGYGLSYTQFDYSELKLTVAGDHVDGQVRVTNTGAVAGTETVQIYVGNQASHIEKPVQSLAGFEQVTLEPGESRTVTFTLEQRAFSWYNPAKATWQLDSGNYLVAVGHDSRNLPLSQQVSLTSDQDNAEPITSESYVGELLHDPRAKQALETSGLAKTFEAIAGGQTTDDQMLLNMPLRAAVMVGATPEQVEAFLKLVN